jgi:hypothetical protein
VAKDEHDQHTADIEHYIAQKQGVKFHPAYGYATPYQIEMLKSLPIGAQRDKILKDIKQLTLAMKKGRKPK